MSRRSLLVFISTVTLTGILSTTVLTPAIPDILADFGRPSGNAGYLVAVGTVAGIIVAPITGFAADRFGRRVVLTVCLAVFGLFGGLSAVAPTFGFLLIVRFVQGAGSAGLVNLAVVLIGVHWSGARRTLLIGRNSAILTAGLALIPPLSGAITDMAGWRAAFAIYTVSLATAVAAWVMLGDRRPANPSDVKAQIVGSVAVLRRPMIQAAIVIGALVFMVIFGLFLTVLPVHLDEVFGLGAGQRGLVIATPALMATLASLNLGRLRSLLTARAMVALAATGFAVAFILIGTTTTLVVVILAALVYGTAEGTLMPLLQDLVLEDSPGEFRAVAMAVWIGFARLGQTVGPLLAGVMLGSVTTGVTFMAGSAVAGVDPRPCALRPTLDESTGCGALPGHRASSLRLRFPGPKCG
jgi:ACDE family multidrug resistance protein